MHNKITQFIHVLALGLMPIACSNNISIIHKDSLDTSVSVGNSESYGLDYPGRVINIAAMSVARAAHTATLLKNGTVLICGGMTGSTGLSSAEIYDHSSKSFMQTGSMASSRLDHSATLLPDGKVLIAGGYNGNYLATTEIYDPHLRRFEPGPNMNTARSGHTATAMNNGKILFAGGVGTGWTFLSDAEIYDIQTKIFIPVNPMNTARESHTATLLTNGNVLITGGHRERRKNIKIYSSCEIYDSRLNQFRAVGDMRIARHKHDAVLLSDGRVLINGGSDRRDSRGVYASGEIFDPQTSEFTMLSATMIHPRYKHKGTSLRLPDGNVFIGGGAERAEVYQVNESKFFSIQGSMETARLFSCSTQLGNGDVLITGGYDEANKTSDRAWLYVEK